MAAGDVTPGRRRDWDSTRPWELESGDYMYNCREDGTIGVWVWTPDKPGHGPCELSTWSPVVHEDGTLTLSPSILAHAVTLGPLNDHTPGEPFTVPEWHGYLERGIWREV